MLKTTGSVFIFALIPFLSACNQSKESSSTTATEDGNVRPDSPDSATTCYAGNESGVDTAI